MGSDYSFELISIVHWVPQFIGHNKIFLGSVVRSLTIFLSFSVTHVLRNGIPQWWWFDVPHSTVWKIRFRTGKILLCRNHVGIKILTQKRNRLQVIIDLYGFFLFSENDCLMTAWPLPEDYIFHNWDFVFYNRQQQDNENHSLKINSTSYLNVTLIYICIGRMQV